MVVVIRDRIRDMARKGLTLAQVKAAHITMDYDRRFGTDSGTWTTDKFIEVVYHDVSGLK